MGNLQSDACSKMVEEFAKGSARLAQFGPVLIFQVLEQGTKNAKGHTLAEDLKALGIPVPKSSDQIKIGTASVADWTPPGIGAPIGVAFTFQALVSCNLVEVRVDMGMTQGTQTPALALGYESVCRIPCPSVLQGKSPCVGI